MMKKELWKSVVGFEGKYEVSDAGEVRSLPAFSRRKYLHSLSQAEDKDGYLVVGLADQGRSRTRRVHHLVLEAFHGPRPSSRHQCRHLNGDSQDNRADNLAWGTAKDNAQDAILHGTRPRGEAVHNSKLTEKQVVTARLLYKGGFTYKELAKRFAVAIPTIMAAVEGETWAHAPFPT